MVTIEQVNNARDHYFFTRMSALRERIALNTAKTTLLTAEKMLLAKHPEDVRTLLEESRDVKQDNLALREITCELGESRAEHAYDVLTILENQWQRQQDEEQSDDN